MPDYPSITLAASTTSRCCGISSRYVESILSWCRQALFQTVRVLRSPALDNLDISSRRCPISLRLPHHWPVRPHRSCKHVTGACLRPDPDQLPCTSVQRRRWRGYQHNWHHYRNLHWETLCRRSHYSGLWTGSWHADHSNCESQSNLCRRAQGANRINTAFMLMTFMGQLTGTSAGNRLHARGGWVASGSLSIAFIAFSFVVCAARGPWEEGWIGWVADGVFESESMLALMVKLWRNRLCFTTRGTDV
jgi:hypothetical protein